MIRFRPPGAVARAILSLIPLFAFPNPALADGGDALNFSLRHGLTYDDNVFLVPDGASPSLTPNGRSDTISVSSVGAVFDQHYGMQGVRLSAEHTVSRYRRHPQNDSDNQSAAATWKWRSGNRWDGDVLWSRNESQTSFGELNLPAANTATMTEAGLSAKRWIHPDWAAGMRYSRQERRNSLATFAVSDGEARHFEGLIVFQPASGNTVTARYHASRIDYVDSRVPGAPHDYFLEDEASVDARYQASGASELGLSASRVSKRYRGGGVRDFQGWTGGANWTWRPTGQLSFGLSAQRSLSGIEEAQARSTVSDSLSARLTWTPRGKWSCEATMQASTLDVLGEGPEATELTVHSGLALSYAPLSGLGVSLSVGSDRRLTQDGARDFSARQFGASVAWTF